MKKFGLISISSIVAYICIAVAVTGFVCLGVSLSRINQTLQTAEQSYTFTRHSQHKVLAVSYANAGDRLFNAQLKGLREPFDDDYMIIYQDTMDARRFDEENAVSYFVDTYEKKYSDYADLETFVACDNVTLKFVLDNYDQFFSNMNIFFMYCTDMDLVLEASKYNNIAGIYERIPIEENVAAAIKLYPSSTRLLAITDDTLFGKAAEKQFNYCKNTLPISNIELLNFSEYHLNEFEDRLNNLPENTIVLYMSAEKDMDSIKYTGADISDIICSSTNLPLFTVCYEGIEEGFLGGCISAITQAGRDTAHLINKVVTGQIEMKNIPLTTGQGIKLFFNEQVFLSRGLSKRNLSGVYEFINLKPNAWRDNKSILLPFTVIVAALLVQVFVLISSLSNLNKSRKSYKYLAHHDPLTKLPNRTDAHSFINSLIKAGKKYSIASIDIDDFKNINDFYSHGCGDKVLKEFGKRLNRLMEENPDFYACRFGGDEFICVFSREINEDDADLFYLKHSLNDPVEYEGNKIFPKVSIGVANAPDGVSFEEFLTNVDLSLYEAKRNGLNKTIFFNADIKSKAIRSNQISKKLENACLRGEFELRYQPQIDLETGMIYGYEALTRLSDFSFSPSEFIPVAEECGYISRLGRIVTEKVIRQIADWRRKGMKLSQVAINFSSGQMGDVDYVSFLKELLKRYKISPELIEIEITESLLMKDQQTALDLFNSFHEIGVKLALDDFGTGYSSLSYLSKFPVDTVKIDKSLVDNYLNGGPKEIMFLRNIVNMVHGLDKKITVEGIEEYWQLDVLKAIHADYIQGYYYSKPISAGEIEAFTKKFGA